MTPCFPYFYDVRLRVFHMTPCFPYFYDVRLRVFHDSVFSIFFSDVRLRVFHMTPCFPYFYDVRLQETPGLRLRGSDSGTPTPCFPSNQRTFLYSASILFNCLDSDSVVWDSCNINCHQRLLKLQKRAARIILDVDKRTPSIELFNKLKPKWLPLSKQSLIKRTSITFKRVNTDYLTLNI